MTFTKVLLFIALFAFQATWAADSSEILLELGKINVQMKNPDANAGKIQAGLDRVDALLIKNGGNAMPNVVLEKIADARQAVDRANVVRGISDTQSQLAYEVCHMSAFMENPKLGGPATVTRFWEQAAGASKSDGSKGYGYFGGNLLLVYALQGHDNEAKVSRVGKELVEWCQSSDKEAKQAQWQQKCASYERAASNPSAFIDSFQRNRQWISRNQFISSYNASTDKFLSGKDAQEQSAGAEEGRVKLEDCARKSPNGAGATAAVQPSGLTQMAGSIAQ